MKICTKCNLEKEEHEFYLEKVNGLRSACKACDRKRANKWHTNNPLKSRLLKTKSWASRHNIPFNIEISDIVIPSVCPVLKVPMDRGTMYEPSIDRIIPALGYVKGNIQVISRKANAMKFDSTFEERHLFAEWVLNQELERKETNIE